MLNWSNVVLYIEWFRESYQWFVGCFIDVGVIDVDVIYWVVFVFVFYGLEDDFIMNYGNEIVQVFFEMLWEELIIMLFCLMVEFVCW